MTARPRVVVLGRQGSGKGTQGMRLAGQLGVPHLSTGDLFRAAVRAGTEVGAEVDHLLKEGLLVPDDLVIDVVRDEAERSQWSVTGYVLDGFPRTVAQAEAFFGTPHIDLPPEAASHGAFDVAIELDVPLAEARRRLATRRVCPVCGTIVSVDDAAVEAIPCPRATAPPCGAATTVTTPSTAAWRSTSVRPARSPRGSRPGDASSPSTARAPQTRSTSAWSTRWPPSWGSPRSPRTDPPSPSPPAVHRCQGGG